MLTLAEEFTPSGAIWFLSGRLDSATAGQLEAKAVASGAAITLDLTHVSYVSSAGLRAILLIYKKATAEGGSLQVAGLQPVVREVFEISGFLAIVPVTPPSPGPV